MILRILYRDKNFELNVDKQTKIKNIKKTIQRQTSLQLDQQLLSFIDKNGNKVLLDDEEMPLFAVDLENNMQIDVKNIGKQIKWEYVFYIEYLGPILIMPAFYYLGKKQSYSLAQSMGLIMGVTHYLKRQLQTAFIHVFSRKSMPFKRVFINSGHYWILFAVLNSIELFLRPKKMKYNKSIAMVLFMIWGLMEFCNFKCHQELASFRKKEKSDLSQSKYKNSKKTRGIPKGWGFRYVSCANYLWETLGWLVFSILTKNYTGFLFTGVSAVQMGEWALKKHKNYKKEFGDKYPKNRKAFIPFIL